MRRGAVPFLLVTLLLAGCAAPDSGFRAAGVRDGAPLGGVALACPPGESERRGDACLARLAEPLVQLSEPALAVHPEDPQVMAVAAHAIGASGSPALVAGRLFVTRDGGASWTRATIPLPGPPGTFYSDPAVAFAPDGTLHVGGMALHSQVPTRIFHASTTDDGRTWTGPTVVSPPGRWDREWVSVSPEGRVFVSWQQPYETSMVAWSDDGTAWETAEPAPKGCFTASPVAFVRGEPWVGCFVKDEGIRLFAVDVDAKALAPRATVPLPCIAPRILAPADGALVVTCYGPAYALSLDDGRSWALVDVAARVAVDDAWGEPAQAYWSEVDARGVLHMQFSTFHRLRGDLVPGLLAHVEGEPRRIAYAALDPLTGEVLHELQLADDAPESRAAPPVSLVPSLGDDWNGIAFAGNEGAMVWMNGGVLEWTRVTPGA